MYEFNILLLHQFSITKSDIKDNATLTVFLLLPSLYLAGHIVHGIDLLIFKFGRYVWDFKENHKTTLKKFLLLPIFNLTNFLINGNRVTGMLNEKGIDSHEFWKHVSKLQYDGKFQNAEYWNLMNDLFKGLTLISLCWSIYYSIEFSKIDLAMATGLTLIFWNRARHMAINFVSTARNTYAMANPTP